MVIVAGHIIVDPAERDDYLAGCVEVVQQARRAAGCLDFALSADAIDSGRVNIFERWESQSAVEAFRGWGHLPPEGQGDGPSDEQGATILSASVAEYDVAGEKSLLG